MSQYTLEQIYDLLNRMTPGERRGAHLIVVTYDNDGDAVHSHVSMIETAYHNGKTTPTQLRLYPGNAWQEEDEE